MATNAADANSISNVVARLYAQSLGVLGQRAIMPALVNRAYEEQANGQRGSVISVPFSSAATTYEVEPSTNNPTDVNGFAPTIKNITLSEWRASHYAVTDKEDTEILAGIIPGQADAAMLALSTFVEEFILKLYKQSWNHVGIAGTTPFTRAAGTTDASRLEFSQIGETAVVNSTIAKMTENFTPSNDRRLILDSAAQANALGIAAYQNYSWSNNADAIRAGTLDMRQGFNIFASTSLPFHVAGGSAALAGNNRRETTGTAAIGNTSVAVASLADEDFLEGDLIAFVGDTQQYVITAQTPTTIEFLPGLKVAKATGTLITTTPSHQVNLAFQRDAITFVNKPLPVRRAEVAAGIDPASGLALRLEQKRQNKQDLWEFDILFGGAMLRPEHVVRILG